MFDYFEKSAVLIIADIFSVVTILSCLIAKIPQIRRIQQTQSAQGISVSGLCLELFSYSVMMSYNYTNSYAFLSYLEYPILLIQEYALVYLVFKFKDLLGVRAASGAIIYVATLVAVILKLIPLSILLFLVPFCTPIGATSKILQLLAIIKSKDASSVSLTTWFISAFTNFTRIYTICVESQDLMLLTNFVISFLLSMSVFLAAFVYKKPKSE